MKTVQEVVEAASSIEIDPDRVVTCTPDFAFPPGGVHLRWPDEPLAQEARMMEVKWPAALAYIRANRLNRTVIAGPQDRLGIVATGKAFSDTQQALLDLGLDEAACREAGVRLYKVGVVWPLEPEGVREFARGLQEILVVEEKRSIVEQQLKDQLYSLPDRPAIVGKYEEGRDHGSEWLLRATADLTPALIAQTIAQRLAQMSVPAEIRMRMEQRLDTIASVQRALAPNGTAAAKRLPWFCPGCPHNTSTKLPEGSRATAGIGCHGMVVWMDRDTTSWTQMGGEGVPWVGQSEFSTRQHMFANLGDGTYSHSGLLAIRQSISAGVNITYKILFNSAVAMTGGQQAESHLDVPAMTRELQAEGVARIVIVTDEVAQYSALAGIAPGTAIRHRDELDAVQRELRDSKGVTALIYAQVCATKKRRDRKRGTMADPAKRVIINELVCEGCGDCGAASNCLAVQPVETEFGRKRKINQNSCNKDFSCLKGFCPSFVTVEGGKLRKPAAKDRPTASALPPIPEPTLPCGITRIVVAGVGGTGVVTIGQVLGMAAHLEGKGVITQDLTGMAQMGGATWSHIQIAPEFAALHATKVDTGLADVVLACDAIVGANDATLGTIAAGRTFVVLNTHATPTASFLLEPDWQPRTGTSAARITRLVRPGLLGALDAEEVATRLLGQSIFSNLLMLGYAWQKGRIPLSHQALMRAIELNAVQIEDNKTAFEWGRRCAHDPAQVQALLGQQDNEAPPSLDEIVAKRVEFLTRYQDADYAADYAAYVAKVQSCERRFGSESLTEAVARNLFKLMAYKDEYEVARLHTDPQFTASIGAMFEGDYKLVHHLAPPLLARKGADGKPVKRAYGPWVRTGLRVLARLKRLRGTAFDPFGYTAERRAERALIGEYRASIDMVVPALSSHNLARAAEIARLPEGIRGFGHVKERNLEAVKTRWARLMTEWRKQDVIAPAHAASEPEQVCA
jgi:indolepyruvate ferredoxin oxidoreductase